MVVGVDADVFFSYTHALRHPVIIGRVAGWRLPWALSATQLGAIAATTAVMLALRPLWAHLGGVGNLVVFSVVVAGVGWAVRHWRVEGRSPLKAAVGMAVVRLAPGCRNGICNGRPLRPDRPSRSRGVPVAVVEVSGVGGDGG
jgi:hypothetical protein